jgi:hypothetical protein
MAKRPRWTLHHVPLVQSQFVLTKKNRRYEFCVPRRLNTPHCFVAKKNRGIAL